MHSKVKIQKNVYKGDNFNTGSETKGSLKLIDCRENGMEEKDDFGMDFFLENDPVYIGKYESEMFLNLIKNKKETVA